MEKSKTTDHLDNLPASGFKNYWVWIAKQTPVVVVLIVFNVIQFQTIRKLEDKIDVLQAKLELYMVKR